MKRTLLVVLALTACTSNPPPPHRSGDLPAGGVLRVGITIPAGVDPGNAYEPQSDLIARTMCDPLIAADPKTGDLRPGLVANWVVSDGGQRLVLRLRKGIRFSDGSSVGAERVAATLSKIASADYAGAVADRLSAIDGYAQVHGDDDAASDRDRQRLRGVRVLDSDSLEITLVRRQADFLRLLTSALVTPTKGPAEQPVCSGPYRLTAPYHPSDQTVTLQRSNELGYADRIEFHISKDPAAEQRAGRVDLAAADATDTTHVVDGPSPLVDYLGFPTTVGPVFDKPEVRRALALALNRASLVATVFPNTRTPAVGFLPPTTAPVFDKGCADLPVTGDVPQAKALLAAKDIDLSDVRVPYLVNEDGDNVRLAKAVAAQWKSTLGLTATVLPVPFQTYLKQVGAATGPFRFSWATPYPDPDGQLFSLFATDRIGKDNASHYSSPDFDRTITRLAREAQEAADRQLEYRHAEQVLCTDLPMVPLTFSLSRYLVAPALATDSVWIDRTTGQPLLSHISLSR